MKERNRLIISLLEKNDCDSTLKILAASETPEDSDGAEDMLSFIFVFIYGVICTSKFYISSVSKNILLSNKIGIHMKSIGTLKNCLGDSKMKLFL